MFLVPPDYTLHSFIPFIGPFSRHVTEARDLMQFVVNLG